MNRTRRQVLRIALAGAGAGPWFIRDLRAAAAPIEVAGIHDLSGGVRVYGRPMIDALTLAVEQANAAGGLLGREVALTNYDPKSSTKYEDHALTAATAATEKGAAVVFGGITSSSREAIRPVMHRLNALYFYSAVYEGGVCDRNCFCIGSTPAQNLGQLVPYAMKKFSGKSVYLLATDAQYGQIAVKWIKKFVVGNGGSIVNADLIPPAETDFTTTIAKIKVAKPDMIVSALVNAFHVSFFHQWAVAGMKKQIPIASTTFGLGNELESLSADEHNGILASYAYFQQLPTAANAGFLRSYYQRFGKTAEPVSELGAMTYHAFGLWAKAVQQAGTTDRLPVIEALESGIFYDGPAGRTTIDPASHHAILDVYLAEARNGRFDVLEKFAQQEPSDTASVCDLKKRPDDNQQYVISVKV